jgi:MoaA/NifB/PqqE/SkfB family radical SAM enzyme
MQILAEKQFVLLPTVCKVLPTVVQIEPTNICNLKCPLCPHNRISSDGKRHLSFKEFKYIIDKFDYRTRIFLTKFGEPFLNPEVFRIIDYAKNKGHNICLSSNFDIDKSIIKDIAKSRLDKILISLDGFSQESNSKYRIGSNFNNIKGNMLYLNQLKRDQNLPPLSITWQYLVNKYNENEITNASMFAKENGISIEFSNMGLAEDLPEYNSGDLEKLKRKWLPNNTQFIRNYLLNNTPTYVANSVCPFLWRSISINVDMKVTPCCYTYSDQSCFGDISKDTIETIWNNEYYQAARCLFNGKTSANNSKKIICGSCNNFAKGISRFNHFKTYINFISNKIEGWNK